MSVASDFGANIVKLCFKTKKERTHYQNGYPIAKCIPKFFTKAPVTL